MSDLREAIKHLARIPTYQLGFDDVYRVQEFIEYLQDMKERYGETI